MGEEIDNKEHSGTFEVIKMFYILIYGSSLLMYPLSKPPERCP